MLVIDWIAGLPTTVTAAGINVIQTHAELLRAFAKGMAGLMPHHQLCLAQEH
jgi:hypothetical protein